ncbi:hypothetical protein [Idiomarina piscisalsi]|uniref:hypothetical protein n=1 Tax=Idiomarina piscisalsi TaxID=1096243 RepID=UPI001380E16C|nr:hypothetical protein [Idiomarina piscisalsi]MTJ01538.1 hypothetical protein [Idiomarina piscisalsi]
MLQFRRIFLFIPLSILLPALVVAVLVLIFDRLGVSPDDIAFLVISYIASGALTFVVYWWFAKGVNKSPYLHAFVVYLCSSLISTFVLMLIVGTGYISPTLAFDALISIMVIFVATNVGYKSKSESSNVS